MEKSRLYKSIDTAGNRFEVAACATRLYLAGSEVENDDNLVWNVAKIVSERMTLEEMFEGIDIEQENNPIEETICFCIVRDLVSNGVKDIIGAIEGENFEEDSRVKFLANKSYSKIEKVIREVLDELKEEEEKEQNREKYYCVAFEIAPHRCHTKKEIIRRVRSRLHYRWDVEETSPVMLRLNGGKWQCSVCFKTSYNREDTARKIAYRFGKTSPKPWPRCKVVDLV